MIRCPFSIVCLHVSNKLSIWCSVGLISTGGSTSPVGLMTCSTIAPPVLFNSYSPGVALTKMVWGRITSHSSRLSGLLSTQLGSLKPYLDRVDFLEKSPLYMPEIWPQVIWLSSINNKEFLGIYSYKVGGGSPGLRPVR